MPAYVPPGFATITPYIAVPNAAAYITFLQAALGGIEIGRSTRPDGTIANAQIRFTDSTIMLSDATAEYPASRISLYFYVENADAAVAQALAHGASLEMAVADMPYGDRQGGIVDPNGNIWWLSQRLVEKPYF